MMIKSLTFASAALGLSMAATGVLADERPDVETDTGPVALTTEQMDEVTAAGHHQTGLVNVNVGDVTVQGNQLVVAVNAAVLGRSAQLVDADN